MCVRISRAAHATLLAEAAASPTQEVCGLLLGDDVIRRIGPTLNVSLQPADSFEIDPAALFAAIRAERATGGERLIGYYHSHPSGRAEPSERDREQAVGDVRLWVVIGAGEAKGWRMTANGVFERVLLQLVD